MAFDPFRVFQRKPRVYGIIYLVLIPAYAMVYFWFPGLIGNERSFLACLYFSTVTITTLGYGDITPLGQAGQLVTASEALLGVVSIGLFLNAIASARSDTVRAEQAEKERKTLEADQRARLNGHYRLIQPIVKKYRLSVIEITHPVTEPSEQYNPDFKLNDMKDMYQPTRLSKSPLLRSAIIGYFEVSDNLYEEISDLIKRVDLRHFPEIEQLCLQICQVISEFDYSGKILSALNTRTGGRSAAEDARDMLEQYEGDCLPHSRANVLNGYIFLYHQIKLIMECLSRFEVEVEREINSKV